MFTRIHSATVVVSDQAAALDFYVGKLGWEKRMDNPYGDGSRWLTVAPPGAATELSLGLAKDYQTGQPMPNADSGISLIVEDLDATYQELVARGVTFRQPPATMPWGAKATWLSDPDGNTFFVTEA